MKIIALDSSGLVASVAVMEEGNMIGEYTVHHKKTHSQTLLPMLDEVVRMIGLNLHTIDGIAIASGPGSFTGLRIGSATVKGLGMALDKPIIEVPTLEALAYNIYGTERLICPIMDARRGQVYTGVYEWKDTEFRTVMEQSAVSVEELIQILSSYQRPVIFLGDGVPVYQEKLLELLHTNIIFAPPHLLRQRAGAVAARGLYYLNSNKTVTACEHRPEYLRLSQAERERLEK